MPDDLMDWFMELGASYFDLAVIAVGVVFARVVFYKFKQCRKDRRQEIGDLKRELNNKIDDLKDREISLLFKKTDENKKSYNQVDKLSYGCAIAIQATTGIELIKQSADGEGDHALNRDVKLPSKP